MGCSSDEPDTQAVAPATTPTVVEPATTEALTSTTAVAAPSASTTTGKAVVTTAAPSRTVRLEQFQTPTKNIACAATGEDVRCDIEARSWTPPPRPRSCDADFDWGQRLQHPSDGTATGNCATDTVLDKASPVLAYGEASTVGPITCVSRLDGLTCTHARTDRGFFLSRGSYKLF
jgi:hypothetical protein